MSATATARQADNSDNDAGRLKICLLLHVFTNEISKDVFLSQFGLNIFFFVLDKATCRVEGPRFDLIYFLFNIFT